MTNGKLSPANRYDTKPIINAINQLQHERQSVVGNSKDTNPVIAELCQSIDKKILDQRIKLLNMYKELKKKELERFDPEYVPFIVTTEMADQYCKYVPKFYLDPRICEKKTSITFATELEKIEKEHSLGDYFYGRSTSTYPFMEYKNQREGEPICDQYRVNLSSTNSLIAVADGCNWGRSPAIAAIKASKAFIDHMNKNRDLFVNTRRAARLCLEGLAAAHNSIISGPYEEGQRIGTTTLLGGLVTKVILREEQKECIMEKIDTINDWVFIFASIGDCKAFLWQSRKKRIEELTPDSRNENFLDASDCGGRVGPYIEGGPDTRNLDIFMSPCVTGDIIIVCSDGVHDNFDPQMHGLQPKDLNVDKECWEDCTPSQANAAKAEWRVNEMKRVIDSDDPTVEDITTKFVQYCNEKNVPAQRFMQENLGKRLPNDYTLFPGKMDHTTMVALRVGQIPENLIISTFNEQISLKNKKNIPITLSTENVINVEEELNDDNHNNNHDHTTNHDNTTTSTTTTNDNDSDADDEHNPLRNCDKIEINLLKPGNKNEKGKKQNIVSKSSTIVLSQNLVAQRTKSLESSSSISGIRRTKSDTPSDPVVSEEIEEKRKILKSSRHKRNLSSTISLSIGREIPEETVKSTKSLLRKLTKTLRKINLLLSDSSFDCFPLGTLQKYSKRLSDGINQLVEKISPFDFDENINSLNVAKNNFINFIIVSFFFVLFLIISNYYFKLQEQFKIELSEDINEKLVATKKETPETIDDTETTETTVEIGKSAKKRFDALRRVLLMELKIIRQLVSTG